MMTELSGILITLLSTTTVSTIGGALWYRHHHKKMNSLQEQLESANVEMANIKGQSDKWHLYQEQLDVANKRIVDLLEVNAAKENRNQELGDRYNKRINEIEDRFNKQTEVLRSANTKLNKALERINQLTYEKGKLKLVIQYLDQWKCYRAYGSGKEDCRRREPEQGAKKFKHIPLNEDLQRVLDGVNNESHEATMEEVTNG